MADRKALWIQAVGPTSAAPCSACDSVPLLWVGGAEMPDAPRRTANVLFADFHQVEATLDDLRTDPVVATALINRRFDCIDLAQLLSFLRFRGTYRVLAGDLPDPDLVRDEIASLCPTLRVEVTQRSDAGLLRRA